MTLYTPNEVIKEETSNLFPDDVDTDVSKYSGTQKSVTATTLALADLHGDDKKNVDTEYTGLTSSYLDQIEKGQEASARDRIVNSLKARESEQLNSLFQELVSNRDPSIAATEEDLEAIALNVESISALAQERQRGTPHHNSVERAALEQLTDLAYRDPVMAEILSNNLEQGDTLQLIQNNLTKSMIIQRDIDALQRDVEDDPLYKKVYEFLGIFNPLTTFDTQINDISDTESKKWFNTAQSLIDSRNELMNPTLSLEEFNDKWEDWKEQAKEGASFILPANKSKMLEAMNKLMVLNENSAAMHNVWSTVDLAGAAPFATAVKVMKTPAAMLKASGNRKMLSELSADTLNKMADDPVEAGIVGTSDAMQSALSKAIDPDALEDVATGLSTQTAKSKERMQLLREELSAYHQPTRLTENEFEQAANNTIRQLKEKYKGNNSVLDFDVIHSKGSLLEDASTIAVKHGKEDGSGFASEAAARGSATRKGLINYDITQDVESGQFFLKTEHVIDEGDFLRGFQLDEVNLGDTLGHVTRFIKAGTNIAPEVIGDAATMSRASGEAIISKSVLPRTKVIESLGLGDRKKLETVLTKGAQEQKWYSDAELQAMDLNKKTRDAYTAAVELSDLDYLLRNAQQYKHALIANKKQIEINAFGKVEYSGLGKEINPNTFDGAKVRIYNAQTGNFLEEGLSKENLVKIIEDNDLKLVQLSTNARNVNKDPVQYILAGSDEMQIGELNKIQLPYLAGGRRHYSDKYFIKQTVTGQYSDSTRKYILNPLTHATASTKAKAQSFADKHNKALDLWRAVGKGDIDRLKATSQIEELIGRTYDELDEAIEKGEIKDTLFEVTFDREQPVSMVKVQLAGGADNLAEETIDAGLPQWHLKMGQGSEARRGAHLPSVDGELAKVLDPFETLTKSLSEIVHTGSWVNFQDTAISRWVKSAKASGLLDNRDLPSGASDLFVFNNAVIDSRLDAAAANKLLASRESIQRMLRMKTKSGRLYETQIRRLAEWVEDKPAGAYLSEKALNMQDKSPIGAIRGLAFNIKLGLFNVSQLLLQAQTSFAITSIDPINGIKGIQSYWVSRLLMNNQNDEVLEYLSKNPKWKAVHGFEDAEEFKTYIKELRASGHAEIGTSVMDSDTLATTLHGNFSKWAGRANEMGRIPYNEGERINRLVSYRVAWERTKKAFPDIDMTSDKARREIARNMRNLNLNMSSESAAWWNRGILAVPTQFKSHQVRLLEAVFDDRQFSAAERIRLAAGQLAMYGTSGAPLMNYISEQYFKANGEDLDPITYKAISSGLWDTMLFAMSDGDVDTNFADRAGIGAGWEDTVHQMFGGDFGSSFFDVLGGPAGSAVISPVTESLGILWNHSKHEKGTGPLIGEAIMRNLTNEISSLSTATRAYYMWNYGMVLHRKDLTPIARSNKWEAVALVMGLNPAKEADYYSMIKDMNSDDKQIRELSGVVKNIRMRMLLSDDPKEIEQLGEKVDAFMSGIKDERTKAKILKEVNKSRTQFKYFEALKRHKERFGNSAVNEIKLQKEEN
jgi:hypothetical protein